MPSKFRESLLRIVDEVSPDERMKLIEDIADEYDDDEIGSLKTIKEERDVFKESLSKSEARYEELDKRYKERFVAGGEVDTPDDDDEPQTDTTHKSLKELGF